MKRVYTLHPYLFALYGVLALITNNITQISLDSLRVVLFSTIACSLVLAFFYLVLKNVVKASLISSVAILLIFSFGHAKSMIQSNSSINGYFYIFVLSLVWCVLFISWIYVVLKVLKTYDLLSKYFFLVSIVLLIFPLYSLSIFYIQRIGKEEQIKAFLQDSWDQFGVIEAERELIAPKNLPDIYYIILDSYARSDILNEFYNYNNYEFHESLESRGFYVAEESKSNYSHTSYSLSSSMNMILINSLPKYATRGLSFNKKWLIGEASIDILQSNRLMDILRQEGYQIVSFDTGYESINFPDADYPMSSPTVENSIYTSKNLFEIFFIDTFVGDLFIQDEPSESALVSSMYDAHRERIMYIFDHLHDFASEKGSFFVFAHVIAPHPPYVFGPNGEKIENEEVFTLDDVAKSNRDYKLYIGELQYLNTLLIEAIDRILSESDEPPIIIIQSDHGSRLLPDGDITKKIKDKTLFPILNAYYFPGLNVETVLYPTISPVNSFRVVLNQYFGGNLTLIDDQSFELDNNSDYEFIPVCVNSDCE